MATGEVNDFPLSDNFRLREFQCACCGQVKLHPYLVQRLQALRERLGRPVLINSGYRCKKHNAAVGGAPQSLHLEGMAADIRVAGIAASKLGHLSEALGFTGIGIYPGFVHVDIRPGKARW
ncbi:MAG: DUF882 domain-containing protein [Firmicutes bacterium]|nr:DUF882 domain-containing protein [Bacillota bacterium]